MKNPAVNPDNNATVFAAAGTGKTWLLVSRLLRLLLQGTRPDSILAITFTKKAAAEMYQRLLQRLQLWASCAETELCKYLDEIDCPADEQQQQLARQLYERILMSPYPLRISTFHAFCNDLLTQFPIEADLPPGFEVIDQAREQELRELAWSQLMVEASADPRGQLAQSLTCLFQRCGSFSTHNALNAFLQHRSDWWAWTERKDDPLLWAEQQIAKLFSQEDSTTLLNNFFSPENTLVIRQIAECLNNSAQTSTKKQIAEKIFTILECDSFDETLFTELTRLMLTGTGSVRKLTKASKSTIDAIGEDALFRLETGWQLLGENCQRLMDKFKQKENLTLNTAWYRVGVRYLDLYQQYKLQNRQLDFADQEWRAYQLLNSRDDMLWVQFKLDQRIEHLLVDEFQDTNPTQWRLLLPILEEFSATADSQRSVFLVGDEKQSIYAFRRANPELQNVAAQWLEKRLQSQRHVKTLSYRSAPAVMDVVNRVFSASPYARMLSEFNQHTTVKDNTWGRIEILPAFRIEAGGDNQQNAFRNPFQEPRPEAEKAQQTEARAIAERIRQLLDDTVLIEDGLSIRPIRCGDIKILLRKRTHSSFIEQALREQEIPYQGTSRGGLLTSQEVADIESLLTVLHTPQDNLALARVLVSPLFSATQEDLIQIASQTGESWFERIQVIAESRPPLHPVAEAVEKLRSWLADSRILPLHDLLNKIYFQGNVLARYRAAAETWQQPQIETNLKRLLSLALEIDSGRYPSMNHFLMQLERMQQAGNDAPSEPTPEHPEQPLEILTVHAAKGLEAAVIFLANMGAEKTENNSWDALVDWPADQGRPTHFLLQPANKGLDSKTTNVLQRWQQKIEREKANLLYVALTRASQMLVISASESSNRSRANNPHTEILRAVEPLGHYDSRGYWIYESGTKPAARQLKPEKTRQQPQSKIPEINKPVTKPPAASFEIAPSYLIDDVAATGEKNGRQRGIGIHSILEKLSDTNWSKTEIYHYVAASLNLSPEDTKLEDWFNEAEQVKVRYPELFDGKNFHKAWNELPILYRLKQRQVYGVIDRVIEYDNHILILDYKTRRIQSSHEAQVSAEKYRPQLAYYQRGVQQLWPNKPVKTALLWTTSCDLQFIEIEKQSL